MASERPRDVLALKFGVSKTLIQDAIRIDKTDASILDEVIAGRISIGQALRRVESVASPLPSKGTEDLRTPDLPSDQTGAPTIPGPVSGSKSRPPNSDESEPETKSNQTVYSAPIRSLKGGERSRR